MSSGRESCPKCGGTEHRVLSPGMRECTHELVWYEDVLVHDPRALDFGLPGFGRGQEERRQRCGNRYRVAAPVMSDVACRVNPDGATCGAFAVGHCGDCGTPLCGYHSEYLSSCLLCGWCAGRHREAKAAALRASEEAEKARQQALREAYEERARADQAEYLRVTPGFPFPLAEEDGPVKTYADCRWLVGRFRNQGKASTRAIAGALSALAPDRLTKVVVQGRQGLRPPKRVNGWLFSLRVQLKDTGDDPYNRWRTCDLVHRWLVVPDGTFWEYSGYADKNGPGPRPDVLGFGAQERRWGTIDWQTALFMRSQLLTWLGHPDEVPGVTVLETPGCFGSWAVVPEPGAVLDPPTPLGAISGYTDGPRALT